MDSSAMSFKRLSVMGVLFLFMLAAWVPILDNVAQDQIDAGFQRALVTFSVAKALNGAISMAQSTQVSAQPFGFGVAMTVGELLDPVNDLVEKFSNVMLAAAVAFGIQKVLVSIGGYALVKILVSATVVIWGWMYWKQQTPPRWITNALVLILMVRFAVPVVTVGSDAVFQQFLQPQYQASQEAMGSSSEEVSNMTPEALTDQDTAPAPNEAQEPQVPPTAPATPEAQDSQESVGFVDRMRRQLGAGLGTVSNGARALVGGARSIMNVRQYISDYKEKATKIADDVTTNIINLIVVFLLQTLIVPLAMLWAMYRVASGAFSR